MLKSSAGLGVAAKVGANVSEHEAIASRYRLFTGVHLEPIVLDAPGNSFKWCVQARLQYPFGNFDIWISQVFAEYHVEHFLNASDGAIG